MTSPEAQRPQPKQELNPLDVSREKVNNTLATENPELFAGAISSHENVLYLNQNDPVHTYIELVTLTGMAIQRVKTVQGEESSVLSELRGYEQRYSRTLQNFTPQATTARVTTQPTVTANLSPMTSAKGGEANVATRVRRTQVQTAAPASPEVQQEENFSSFLRQKRTEAHLSQRVLGEALGEGRSNNLKISGLENGKRTVDLEGVGKIITGLGLNEEDIQKAIELYSKQFPPDPQE